MPQRRQRQCDARFITVRSYSRGVGALSVALARFRVGQSPSPEVGTKPAISEGSRPKPTVRDPMQLYRETQGSGWTFFSRPQFRTQQREKKPPAGPAGFFFFSVVNHYDA